MHTTCMRNIALPRQCSPTMLSKKAPRRCQSFLSLRKVIMCESNTSLAFCRPKNTQRRVMPFSISVCLTMFSGSLSRVTTFCWTISCRAWSSGKVEVEGVGWGLFVNNHKPIQQNEGPNLWPREVYSNVNYLSHSFRLGAGSPRRPPHSGHALHSNCSLAPAPGSAVLSQPNVQCSLEEKETSILWGLLFLFLFIAF